MRKHQFRAGQSVRIARGPFSGFLGDIDEVDDATSTAKIVAYVYGRIVPLDLPTSEIELAGLVDRDFRRLALDHLLLDALDRRRRIEDADVPIHQPVEEAA
jgi:hypothetical protein